MGLIPGSGMFFYLFFLVGVLANSRNFLSDRVTNVLRTKISRPNVPETHVATKGTPHGERSQSLPSAQSCCFHDIDASLSLFSFGHKFAPLNV
uniref:Putative secreted protein n=1 Tax=Ixodes ricinus TaxID=34613 RepID=A0A6B0UDE9_IXORI